MTDNELSLSLRADFGVIASWVKNNDKVKNKWCKENNIPLIRIPYTIYDIPDIGNLKNIVLSLIGNE